VLLALDCDTAGETALKPVTAALYANGAALVQRVVWPGGAKDACDVVAARGVVGLAEFLERLLAGRVA
jgi:DNA primase